MLRRLTPLVLALLVVGLAVRPARTDDVPADARKSYDQARELYLAGDLKKAYSAISKGKAKDPLSVDFWELYVRIWRGLDKEEAVLWDKIVGKVEAKNPKSAVFDLLRARLATTPEQRLQHLKAAVAKAPEAIEPRLGLARAYLKTGDDVQAEEILDAILEKDPGNEEALVTKGDLAIESGRSLSALGVADEALAAHDLPGLHDLRARALLQIAENDAGRLPEAEEEARKAVAGRPAPRHVLTLSEVYDRTGKTKEAVALLDEHYARTKDPKLGGRLGEFAMRAGDYQKAIPGLGLLADDDLRAAKALARAFARLQEKEKLEQALSRVLKASEEDESAFIGSQLLVAGDPQAALARVEGKTDEKALVTRAWAHAMLGSVDGARADVAEKVKAGGALAEDWALPLLTAQAFAKLGPKADQVRKQLLAAALAAARAVVPSATPPEHEVLVPAHSMGFAQRAISYRLSVCGSRFKPTTNLNISVEQRDGKPLLVVSLTGVSSCPEDAQRNFPVAEIPVEGDQVDPSVALGALLGEGNQAWPGVLAKFDEGVQSLLAGEWALAATALDAALAGEPGWGRARLLAACARAMAGDLGKVAAETKAALAVLPDDWDAWRLGILLLVLAGEEPSVEMEAAAKRREAYATRRLDRM